LFDEARGDLASAETYYQRALPILERLAPDSLSVATSLNSLAAVAHGRANGVLAQAYHERALALSEKLAPDSLDVARSLHNLGVEMRDPGDLAKAEDYLARALAIRERAVRLLRSPRLSRTLRSSDESILSGLKRPVCRRAADV
jgi:tetratricopeptide (TPR) repeat protein